MLLKQTGTPEAANNELAFNSGDATSNYPRLVITYNTPPPAPSSMHLLDGDPMSVVVADADAGASLTATFSILDGSTVVWTGSSSPTVSGGTASVTPPYASMAAPKKYTVKAYVSDGQDQSPTISGYLVRDPQGLMLQSAKAMAQAAFSSSANEWTSNVTAAQSSANTASTISSDGVASDDASQFASSVSPFVNDQLAAVDTDRQAVASAELAVSNVHVNTTITDASSAGSGASVALDVETTQNEADISTAGGDMYLLPDGTLVPIDSYGYSTPPATDPTDDETYASWTDSYVATFRVQTSMVTGADGLQHAALMTPVMTGLTRDDSFEPEAASDGDTTWDPLPEDASSADRSLVTPKDQEGPEPGTGPTISYDRMAVAKYARYWTNADHDGNNQVNPKYVTGINPNCANFTSGALYEGGGWPRTGSVTSTSGDKTVWDYDIPNPAYGPSYTWVNARGLYHYSKYQKHLANVKNIYNMVKGELLFADWQSDGKIDHVDVISGRSKSGMPRVSQKSKNRHNMPLIVWLEHDVFAKYKTPTFYGLHYYEKSS